MKKVSIQEFKRNLSAVIAEAANGVRVLVTKHNKPLVQLIPAHQEHIHTGRRFGKANFAPAIRGGTGGRSLKVLLDDRRGDPDGR